MANQHSRDRLAPVLNEIGVERLRQQVELGYLLDHDLGHRPTDWIAMLARYVGRAGDAAETGDAASYRGRLVQIAAIAAAAIESLDAAL